MLNSGLWVIPINNRSKILSYGKWRGETSASGISHSKERTNNLESFPRKPKKKRNRTPNTAIATVNLTGHAHELLQNLSRG